MAELGIYFDIHFPDSARKLDSYLLHATGAETILTYSFGILRSNRAWSAEGLGPQLLGSLLDTTLRCSIMCGIRDRNHRTA